MTLIRNFLCLILLFCSLQTLAKTESDKEIEREVTEIQYILSIMNGPNGFTDLKEYKPKTKAGENAKTSILETFEDNQKFSQEIEKLKPIMIESSDFDNVKSLEEKKNKIATFEKLFLIRFNKVQNKLNLYDQESRRNAHLDEIQNYITETLEILSVFKEKQITYANYMIENNEFVVLMNNPSISTLSSYSTETIKAKSKELLEKTKQYTEARFMFQTDMIKIDGNLDKIQNMNVQNFNNLINQTYNQAG